MLEKGWTHPSVSPYGAPLLFVCKKMGELRMCVDWSGSLNRQTRLDMFPIPCIHDLLDKHMWSENMAAIHLTEQEGSLAPLH